MNIAIIHYRLIYFGGLESRLREYIREFCALGHSVTVFCAKYDPKVELPENVKVIKISPGMAPKPFRRYRFGKKTEAFIRQNHSFDLTIALERTPGQDIALCPGNHLGYLQAMHLSSLGISHFIQIKSDRETFKTSSIILAASEMIKKELVDLYNVPSQKIKVLYPPLNTEKFFTPSLNQRESIRQNLGMKPEEKWFVFVGMGDKRKGLPMLLDIMRELENTNCRLLVIGGGYAIKTSPNVRFVGFQKNTAPYYQAADFLVHPALYEPYGQIVAEALQCGTPVLISDKVGAKEIVNKESGLVLPPQNKEQWKKAMKEVNRSDFSVPANIAEQKKLSSNEHIRSMLDFAQNILTSKKIR